MRLISPIYQSQPLKITTAIVRYNRIVVKRRLRIASFVSAPRLVKGFHNQLQHKPNSVSQRADVI